MSLLLSQHELEHFLLLLEVLVLVEETELPQRVEDRLVGLLGSRDHLQRVLEGRELGVELLDALLQERDAACRPAPCGRGSGRAAPSPP
jgi:hypothetical protein